MHIKSSAQRHSVKDYKWTYLVHSHAGTDTDTPTKGIKRQSERRKEQNKINDEWFWNECENCNAFAKASLSVLNVKERTCSLARFTCPKSEPFVDSLVSSLLSVNFSHAHILSGSVSFLIELSHKLLALFEHCTHFLCAFHHHFFPILTENHIHRRWRKKVENEMMKMKIKCIKWA